MAHITLRLKEGDKEAEVSLEDHGRSSQEEAKALLYEIIGRSTLTAREALIQMAQRRDGRPTRMTHLGKCLYEFTSKASHEYDEEFDVGIRKLAPGWFESKV